MTIGYYVKDGKFHVERSNQWFSTRNQIETLLEDHGSLSLSELSQIFDLTKETIIYHVNTLEKLGIVTSEYRINSRSKRPERVLTKKRLSK